MTAKRLRQAAAKLRENAERAANGPWFLDQQEGGYMDVLAGQGGTETCVASADDRDAPHIAAMHPGVALAMAVVLDSAALEVDAWGWQLLTLADAVLGES